MGETTLTPGTYVITTEAPVVYTTVLVSTSTSFSTVYYTPPPAPIVFDEATASKTDNVNVVTDENGAQSYEMVPDASSPTAAVTQPLPPVSTDASYEISGSISISGYSDPASRKKQKRQDTCTLAILADGNVIQTIDLSTIGSGSTPFRTNSFTPGTDTKITYQETCPPGVPFPRLNLAGVTLSTQTPVASVVPVPVLVTSTALATTFVPTVIPTVVEAAPSAQSPSAAAPASNPAGYVTVVTTIPASTVTRTSVVTSNGGTVTLTLPSIVPGTTLVSTVVSTVNNVVTCYVGSYGTACMPSPTSARSTTYISQTGSSPPMSINNPPTMSASPPTHMTQSGSAPMMSRSNSLSPSHPPGVVATVTNTHRTQCGDARTVYVTAYPSWYSPTPGLYSTSMLYMPHG